MLTLDDITRVARGALWGRAEEYSRVYPDLTIGEALHKAADDFEAGRMSTSVIDDRFIHALQTAPHTLMKSQLPR